MIHGIETLRGGFEAEADVIVIGSGAGGAVAAANCAEAGMRTVVLEAGPQVRAEDMTRDAPRFLAKYFWDGGLRLLEGTARIPTMQGRALGGSTVSNSAIMFKLPDWVREEWATKDGLTHLRDEAFDRAFERVLTGTSTAPTPMNVQGPRNLIVRDVLDRMGERNGPLPRAVTGCQGCADCIIGCACGAKQSVDRSWIPRAAIAGAQVYTCSQVDRILMEGDRAVGVTGRVIDVATWETVGRFTVRAPRVIVAASAMGTPCVLQKSGINPRGLVGATLEAHLSGGVFAVMEQPMHPWIGASQGWGAISQHVRGMKFESLWADPSVMLVKWGGHGRELLAGLEDVRYMSIGAIVYRGRCHGTVKARRDGSPRMKFWIPREEAHVVFAAMQRMAKAFLDEGARYTFCGTLPGVPDRMTTHAETEGLLSKQLHGGHLPMTANHVFSSCRMTGDERTGPVAPDGSVRGVRGVYVADASLFPSGSAVNPQATVMALSDLVSRGIADLQA